jgi:hypothetical protein
VHGEPGGRLLASNGEFGAKIGSVSPQLNGLALDQQLADRKIKPSGGLYWCCYGLAAIRT